ncbi:MAG TPA: heavy metal translocating P-type ATPase [Anaeromyxobacter sp.]
MTAPARRAAALRCDHCLTEFPGREAVLEVFGGVEHVFCCHGCLGVFRLVHVEGLGSYYETRRWDGPGAPVGAERGALDLAAFQEAVQDGEGAATLQLYVDGIRCASCVWLVERVLARMPGVSSARVSYATHRARIRWDPGRASLAEVLGRIRAAGYEPKPWSEGAGDAARRAEAKDLLIRLGTAAFLASQLMIYQAALYAGYFQGIDAATRKLLEWIALGLTLPVYLYCGAPFLSGTVRGLRRRSLGMDALVAVGAGAALVYSVWQMLRGGEVYFDTAAMIPTLVLVGRYVEAAAKGRASEAVARLARLAPREARRLVHGEGGRDERETVPVSRVAAGDRIEIVPGERVPLDGVVLEGASEVDESLVTGEARPIAKAPGSAVIGGSVNQHGALVVRVTRTAKEGVLAGIVRAVEEAQESRPRIQAVADRVVGIFVPAMLALAAGTVAFWLARGAPLERALMTGISVVVIACPCALGLATPIAVVVATGLATSRGLLVRRGHVLERAARATNVLLDKTGTVTRGRPVLREVIPLGARMEAGAALALAAAVERRSEHHVGRAIAEAARGVEAAELQVGGFRAIPGRGVVAEARVLVPPQLPNAIPTPTPTPTSTATPPPTSTATATSTSTPASTATATPTPTSSAISTATVLVGNRALLAEHGVALPAEADERASALEARGETVAFLAAGGEVVALFCIADPVREEAGEAIAALRRAGLEVALVSGDAKATTAAVAAGLGVEAVAQASPVEKRAHVARLQESGRRVLFVGDGINDAPALTQAEVGVAMGRGTDVTLESADAVLVRDDLRLVPDLVRLSRRTYRIIAQNVFWAFFYNAVAIPLAMAGLLHPIVAAAAMAASSLFVVGNSLRLRRTFE